MNKKILDYLYSLDSSRVTRDDIELLSELSENSDVEIRINVAQLLSAFPSKKTKKILINMIRDDDALVRTNVCDSLSIFVDKDILSLLLSVIENDKDNMVKCYAILSARDISQNLDYFFQKKTKAVFEKIILDECDDEILIAANSGLYVLGDVKKLDLILQQLNNDNYFIRCFVINVLLDIVNNVNKAEILSNLMKLKQIEDTESVNSTLDYAMNVLTD